LEVLTIGLVSTNSIDQVVLDSSNKRLDEVFPDDLPSLFDEMPFVDVSDIETLSVDVAHDAINGTVVCGDKDVIDQCTVAVKAAFHDQREEHRHSQRQLIDRIATEGLRG